MTIKPFLFGIVVLVIFVGLILGFQRAGYWSVSGKITSDGQAVQPDAGEVDSIKGWMTLEQVSTAYEVPLNQILMAFGLPADTPASTAVKDLESDTFSVEGLREWLLTQAPSGEPEKASEPTQEPTPKPSAVPAEPAATPVPTEHVAPDKTITGKTTFQELLDWSVEAEAIQRVIGGELPSLSIVIKDYVTQQGQPFSEVKAALQAQVDQVEAP